ncbi:MAG TPA: hypothetical protein GXZ47_01785 [Treponema sp.]|nr:hypothetical protein [Treponema sp.]
MDQDVIGHLIDVERSAFDMMMDAQTEADKRKTTAREEAEKQFRTAHESIVKEQEAALAKEKQHCNNAREQEYNEIAERLSAIEQDGKAFNTYLDSLFLGS